jgi:hypothetical protein
MFLIGEMSLEGSTYPTHLPALVTHTHSKAEENTAEAQVTICLLIFY